MSKLAKHIEALDRRVPTAQEGLPEDIFLFVSRMTPMVNVDLLIQNEAGETLLAWRDDEYAGKGWHVPGGIVRYKETFESRIQKVAQSELGSEVNWDPDIKAIHQVLVEHTNRGHFISMLYACELPHDYVINNTDLTPASPGFLKWHSECPDNMVAVHDVYRSYIQPIGVTS